MLTAPCFHLLFADSPAVSADDLLAALRNYHPVMAQATWADDGLLRWAGHSVSVERRAEPLDSPLLPACIQAALLPPEVKHDLRQHRSYVRLEYAGEEVDPFERFVAVAAVAGVWAEFGAMAVVHEAARAAILATDLLPDEPGEDMLAVLRTLPIPYLYGGFVKITLTDRPGVWMRTFACHLLGLPNLALQAARHDQGQETFRMFTAVLNYLRHTGAELQPGEALRLDDATFTVREPDETEWWLDSPGPMLILHAAESSEPID